MDLEYGLPIGSLVSAWQPNTAYTSGQYVSYTLNSTQAPDWLPSHAYNAGDVILPKLNNTYNCGIKYTQAGISGRFGAELELRLLRRVYGDQQWADYRRHSQGAEPGRPSDLCFPAGQRQRNFWDV